MYGWRNLDAYLFGLHFESELSFRKVHSGIMNAVIYFVDNSRDLYIYYQGRFVGLGIQFPSDRSNDPVLIKCAFHGGSDMGPWTHVVGTQDGRMWIDLTSEFTLLYWQFVKVKCNS